MTELSLYKFIHNNDIEYHWHEFEEDNNDVVIFVHDYQLEDLRGLLSFSDYDDEGIEVILKDTYICIRMGILCEYNEIYMDNIFEEGK